MKKSTFLKTFLLATILLVGNGLVWGENILPKLELLEKKGVASVPGVGFGSEGYARFSFATDIESIRKGIKRIEEFVRDMA